MEREIRYTVLVGHAKEDGAVARQLADAIESAGVQTDVVDLDINREPYRIQASGTPFGKADEATLLVTGTSLRRSSLWFAAGTIWGLGQHVTPVLCEATEQELPPPLRGYPVVGIADLEPLLGGIQRRTKAKEKALGTFTEQQFVAFLSDFEKWFTFPFNANKLVRHYSKRDRISYCQMFDYYMSQSPYFVRKRLSMECCAAVYDELRSPNRFANLVARARKTIDRAMEKARYTGILSVDESSGFDTANYRIYERTHME